MIVCVYMMCPDKLGLLPQPAVPCEDNPTKTPANLLVFYPRADSISSQSRTFSPSFVLRVRACELRFSRSYNLPLSAHAPLYTQAPILHLSVLVRRPSSTALNRRLRLLLGGSGLGLGRLLAVAADHDHAEERADDGRTEQDKDDGDANGPHARREEVLERVVGVDKGLSG